MTALTDPLLTGGSPIVSYNLEWDNGSNGASYVSLVGESENNIQLLYTKTDLTAGMTYKFRYRVRNIFGWSSYSDVLTILAATKPDRPAMVSTSNVGTSVRIDWVAPYDGHSPLLYFVLVIKTKTGAFLEETTHCNARTDNTV